MTYIFGFIEELPARVARPLMYNYCHVAPQPIELPAPSLAPESAGTPERHLLLFESF